MPISITLQTVHRVRAAPGSGNTNLGPFSSTTVRAPARKPSGRSRIRCSAPGGYQVVSLGKLSSRSRSAGSAATPAFRPRAAPGGDVVTVIRIDAER